MSINLDGWIGKELVEDDFVSLDRARLLATTLGRKPTELADGGPLPAGWHLIYFNSAVASSEPSCSAALHSASDARAPPITAIRKGGAAAELIRTSP